MQSQSTITLMYDKPCLPDYTGGWGLSLWIEYVNDVILFDSGWNGGILINNLRRSGKNLNEITYIFLTHIHWDHIGGVVHILNQELSNLKAVVIPRSFSMHLKKELSYSAQLFEIPDSSQPKEIANGIWSSGVMGEKIKEHALFLQLSAKQILIVTGCSHPSPTQFLKSASLLGSVYGIIGGFHGFSDLEKFENLKLIIPLHCTKNRLEILSRFPSQSSIIKVGESLHLPSE